MWEGLSVSAPSPSPSLIPCQTISHQPLPPALPAHFFIPWAFPCDAAASPSLPNTANVKYLASKLGVKNYSVLEVHISLNITEL